MLEATSSHLSNLVFDLDGTLYPSMLEIEFQIPWAMLTTTQQYLNIEAEPARSLIREYKSKYKSSVIGLAKHHGIDAEEFMVAAFEKLNTANIRGYAPLRAQLEALARKYRLLLFTNSHGSYANRVLIQLGFEHYFDATFSTEKLDFYRKPEAEAFERFVDRARIEPHASMFFDDSYFNIERAKRMGFTTVQVSNQLARPPYFWEMHARKFHLPKPSADYATHELTDFLNANFFCMEN